MPLYSNILRTEIESKSQLVVKGETITYVVFKYIKNWNWKQITTKAAAFVDCAKLYSNILRTEIESKSQHSGGALRTHLSCIQIY